MKHSVQKPWFKTPYVWMLIAIPLSAVVMGIAMITIAVKTDDGLVKDDYYKHGKQINRVLERDKAAVTHGLSAMIAFDYNAGTVTAKLNSNPEYTIPESINVELLHATQAGHDRMLTLLRTSQGQHFSVLPALAEGHWLVQLSADDWRISGDLYLPGDKTILIEPKK